MNDELNTLHRLRVFVLNSGYKTVHWGNNSVLGDDNCCWIVVSEGRQLVRRMVLSAVHLSIQLTWWRDNPILCLLEDGMQRGVNQILGWSTPDRLLTCNC